MARPTPLSIRLHASTPAPSWEAGRTELSGEELASVLTSVPALILVADRENRVIACTGSPGVQVAPGCDLFDFVPIRHSAFYREQLKRALTGGETVVFDVEGPGFEFDAPDVSTPWRRWTRVRLTPFAVGGDIRGAIALAQDVDRELSLERRENRIRETLDHVGEGMLVVDLVTGAVLECNEAAARLFGIAADELRDTTPAWLQIAPEGGARLGWGALLDELMEGQALRGQAILREGEEVSIELRATSRKLEDGHFAFVLCRNITQDLALERERANQERLATVGSLAAGVAHEINNPLAYVIANVQYALDAINQWQMREADPSADPERRRAQIKEALYEANEGARRVQRIVSDLKALARQGEDRVEPIDVENTLQWAIGVSMPEIRLRARLVRDFDPMPMVRGDEARLGQVFVNILLNAAQAIPAGRPQDHEIRIRAGTRNRRVFIDVLDTGPGIREEHLRRIFDPFFTTKPRGIGTGLGLSICHEIVASMRGSLTAENRPGGGAEIRGRAACAHRCARRARTAAQPPARSQPGPERAHPHHRRRDAGGQGPGPHPARPQGRDLRSRPHRAVARAREPLRRDLLRPDDARPHRHGRARGRLPAMSRRRQAHDLRHRRHLHRRGPQLRRAARDALPVQAVRHVPGAKRHRAHALGTRGSLTRIVLAMPCFARRNCTHPVRR
ncbi:MAG: ATP-binding protein [Myxococcales bacterium]